MAAEPNAAPGPIDEEWFAQLEEIQTRTGCSLSAARAALAAASGDVNAAVERLRAEAAGAGDAAEAARPGGAGGAAGDAGAPDTFGAADASGAAGGAAGADTSDAAGATIRPTVRRVGGESLAGEWRLLAALSHAGGIFGLPVLVPLVIYLLVESSPYVRHHAKQALGWHIGVGLGTAGLAISLIGAVLIPAWLLLGAVFTVVAVVKAVQGERYRYPIIGEWVERL